MLNWFLIFIPGAIALEHLAPTQHVLIFVAAGIAILPLAVWMGRATEHLAERMGEGVGGLLNATFGNAAELIIAFAALRAGLYDVVKASLVGCIIGNILLVLGTSMLAGGLRHRGQRFNAQGARVQATMLMLAAISFILPAAYQVALGDGPKTGLVSLSIAMSIVLLAVYVLFLAFSLRTHAALFAGSHVAESEGELEKAWPISKAAAILATATVAVAWMSEILVGAIQPAAKSIGIGSVFAAVFVVAILSTAAEYYTAVNAALKDRLDLSLSIAIGSSVQIALFVAPALVLASLFLGPGPMDLVIPGGFVLMVLLSVLIASQVASDGRSDWLKGVQLLTVYLIFGLTYFFLPGFTS